MEAPAQQEAFNRRGRAARPQAAGNANRRPPISLSKLILIAVLGGLCLFLQVSVWTLEAMLGERRAELQLRDDDNGNKNDDDAVVDDDDDEDEDEEEEEDEEDGDYNNKKTTSTTMPKRKRTIKPVEITTDPRELHVNRARATADSGSSHQTQANAFWKQAAELWMASWDPNIPQHELYSSSLAESSSSSASSSSSSSSSGSSSFGMSDNQYRQNATIWAWHALEQAAEWGHAHAQFHVANALASGIFLGTVQESWTVPESPQQQRAWLLWHMAAMGGNVEAALALASRLEGQGATCAQQLPYVREAALGMVDALETNVQSRAKVTPASDKHVLYQIHLHGGTPSKLDYHNKADESSDALQFYHLRAMSSRDKETAAGAAFTLANLYHHGARGVVQNLTLAAEYYERAANLNHWEAAGQVGTFYMWGIGVPQDVSRAHKFFRMGMPLGIVGCQRRYQLKLKKSSSSSGTDEDNLSLCDTESINGMGLLKLVGLPHINMRVDVAQAEDLFLMARDQGSADAAYNHAMTKLGWTLHWKPSPGGGNNNNNNRRTTTWSQDKKDQLPPPQTSIKDKVFPMQQTPSDHPTLAEYQAVLTDLTMAAGKGHLQARLRLGLLFAEGVQIPSDGKTTTNNNKDNKDNNNNKAAAGTTTTAVAKDCHKALKQFKWIADNSCPFRAKRLRKAYKQYMAGDTQGSLLNYLTAAETGSTVALLNAAFLLEQGECLSSSSSSPSASSSASASSSSSSSTASSSTLSGSSSSSSSSSTGGFLNSVDCAKASARLWKEAANKGHGEASLRVGDFYYYRRFRDPLDDNVVQVVGPYGWIRYFLYPEQSLPLLWKFLVKQVQQALFSSSSSSSDDANKNELEDGDATNEQQQQVCEVGDDNQQVCQAVDVNTEDSKKKKHNDPYLEGDLEMAAHYYRMASETVDNARAHFNLGFLYEWGLGLKQDFPLAKRHYDLAVSAGGGGGGLGGGGMGSSAKEAELPVAIALTAMSIHEKCLKLFVSLEASVKQALYSEQVIQLVGSKSQLDVIVAHVVSWESLAVLMLTLVLVYVLQVRENQQQRRRP